MTQEEAQARKLADKMKRTLDQALRKGELLGARSLMLLTRKKKDGSFYTIVNVEREYHERDLESLK